MLSFLYKYFRKIVLQDFYLHTLDNLSTDNKRTSK